MTTEERILDSAVNLFSQKGYKNTSIKEIAQDADVNSLTVFRYFHDKENLFLQAVSKMKEGSFDADCLDRALTFRDVEADLLTMSRAYLDEIYNRLPLIRIYIGEGLNFEQMGGERWFISPALKAQFCAYLNRLNIACPLAKKHAGLLGEMFIAYITRKVMSASKHQNVWEKTPEVEAAFCRDLAPQIDAMAVMITGTTTH